MAKPIAVGDCFEWKHNGRIVRGVRLPDNPAPTWPCERMRVRAFAEPAYKLADQDFPAEQEWFHQRGLVAAEGK